MVRILVMDDDVDLLAAIATNVSSHRYTVITTNDVHEAIQIHQHTPVNLVITGPLMPKIDGIGIILAMRARDSVLKVVALSGGSEAHIASVQGADATFTLPLPWDGFLNTIDSLTAHIA